MLDHERMLLWQAEREDADRKWRDVQRQADLQWRDSQEKKESYWHRWELIIIGFVATAVLAAATIWGAYIPRSGQPVINNFSSGQPSVIQGIQTGEQSGTGSNAP